MDSLTLKLTLFRFCSYDYIMSRTSYLAYKNCKRGRVSGKFVY